MSMDLSAFFEYDFLLRALIGGVLVACTAPVMGLFLVVRRYSLLPDALAHVSLLGVAVAVLLGVRPLFGALLFSVLAAAGMERLRRGGKVFGEALVALFLTGSLGLAVLILSALRGVDINIVSYLFGSLTTVTTFDVLVLAGIAGLSITFVILNFRKLFLIALDEDLAAVGGVRVSRENMLFALLAGAVIAASIALVGALLVGALMVIPVLAALAWHQGFRATLMLATGMALLSVVGGFLGALTFNIASGGAIVVAALFLFIFSQLAQKVFATR